MEDANTPNKSISIKTWAEDDRPREKMLLKGKSALSDAELLAILIGSGSRQKTAVELCKEILTYAGNNLSNLSRLSVHDLMKFKGIGEAKAISIAAALELGRRRKDEAPEKKPGIGSSQDAFQLIYPELADLPYEEFWVLYLNRANKLIRKTPIGKGGVSGTVADCRLIFKTAIDLLASSMVLCHNHPSGNLQPSEQDKALTRKIKEAGIMLDISLLDHIIVAGNTFYSFADEGLL